MIDIVSQDTDIGLFDSQVPRAANILQVQLGSLTYAEELGIDLEYFLDPRFEYQNESFKAYLIQRLAEFGINVSTVEETLENLFASYTINIKSDENNTGLIAR